MAFLDNSGDIILDAVLTDIGRKRMAAGNFKITRFALGDDEINYGLYNKDHPSGSAYYDLEVLQSPILEAFTHVNASINYGLVSYARNDLLYLPTMVINTANVHELRTVKSTVTNVIYLPTGKQTLTGKATRMALGESIGGVGTPDYTNILGANNGSDGFVVVETGLNTAADGLAATQANQATYLSQVGLLDGQFIISYDRRFLIGPTSAPGTTMNSDVVSVSGWTSTNGSQNEQSMSDYLSTAVPAVTTRLYASSNTNSNYNAQDKTTFTGPRGAMCFLSFLNRNECEIDQEIFRRFGTINSAMIAGDGTGQTYDYIDTIV